MKLILITLVAVVVGLMVGCESASRTSMLIPTPSGPMYSEEEAIAVLKQHLQTKIFPGEPYPCLLVIEDSIRDPNSVFWRASYDVERRLWNVTAKSRKKPIPPEKPKYYTWSVYERTGSIVATGDDPINQMC